MGLSIVDGLKLSRERQAALRPGEEGADWSGHTHRLPRFFFRIESWEQARELQLTEHFSLSELVKVDSREAPVLLREMPHHVPCAVVILARYLEAFRQKVNAPVCICANGGYRSAAHKLTTAFGPHNWATAADIYRVGDTLLNSQKEIERYGEMVSAMAPEVHVNAFGSSKGQTDDHLHIDIGYVTYVPRTCDEAPI